MWYDRLYTSVDDSRWKIIGKDLSFLVIDPITILLSVLLWLRNEDPRIDCLSLSYSFFRFSIVRLYFDFYFR